jgi:hypothetical protein
MPQATWPAVGAVAFHLGLVLVYLAGSGGDVSILLCAGQNAAGKPPFEAVTASSGAVGYDGQFYYALARNPWKVHRGGLDRPAVRHLRLFYPALCWSVSSFGDPRLLFWVMPLVNLAAIAGLAWLGAGAASRAGMSPWLGFLLPLALTVGMPALRNLTDPLSTLAVFGLLEAWQRRVHWLSLSLWALAAAFSREQNLALILLLAGAAAWARHFRVLTGLAAVLLVWAAWVVVLRTSYGVWPLPPVANTFASVHNKVGVPLGGMAYPLAPSSLPFRSRQAALDFSLGVLYLGLQLALAVYVAVLNRGNRFLLALLLLGMCLVVLGGADLFVDRWSFTRVFVWLPLGIWLGSVQVGRRWPILCLSCGAFWPLWVCFRVCCSHWA